MQDKTPSEPPVARRDRGAEAQALLEQGVASGLYDSLAACVVDPDSTLFQGHAGAAEFESRFDLASLTKPIVATVLIREVMSGSLRVEAKVGRFFPHAAPSLAQVSLADLLRHRSRLAAWVPLYVLCRDPEEATERIVKGEWLGAGIPTYSDLGYILLGRVLEQATSRSLPQLVRELTQESLGLESLEYLPQAPLNVAACNIGTEKEVELAAVLPRRLNAATALEPLSAPSRGQVQDGNARFLGPSGHAGLFGCTADVAAFGVAWLTQKCLDDRLVTRALKGRGRYLQGWEQRRINNSAGSGLSKAAFGHTGFTGGSLWIDPQTSRVFALLGHRSSPSSNLQPFRREFHQLMNAG